MKYYNSDYVNFIVDDEKEKQLVNERNTMKNRHLDPERTLEFQKRFVKHGTRFMVLWLLISLFYLVLSIDCYLERSGDPFQTIGYPLLSTLWGLGAAIFYNEVRRVRKEVFKATGNEGVS